MGKRKKRERKENKTSALTGILLALLLLTLFVYLNDNFLHISGVPTTPQILYHFGFGIKPDVPLSSGEAAVHFIDVGQGDCSLIVTESRAVLIDCGEEEYADTVLRYLNHLGINKLDYVIATHPHSDHIGGMYLILSKKEIGEFIMPELVESMIPLSSVYSRMIDAVEQRNIPARYAKPGETLDLGENAELQILAPLHNDYDDLNNFSVVTRFVYGDNSFLFTGDIERASENDIHNSGREISSDVLKVAHHGSSSSTTNTFLEMVCPEYAVISVGENNSYGHPTKTVLDRLYKAGSEVLTTAEYGNIVFVSNGEELSIHTENGEREAA